VVGADDENVVTGYGNADNARWCRWCSATRTDPSAILWIKEFAPPTTGDRKLTGLTVWGADTAGNQYIAVDTYKTKT